MIVLYIVYKYKYFHLSSIFVEYSVTVHWASIAIFLKWKFLQECKQEVFFRSIRKVCIWITTLMLLLVNIFMQKMHKWVTNTISLYKSTSDLLLFICCFKLVKELMKCCYFNETCLKQICNRRAIVNFRRKGNFKKRKTSRIC